MKNRKLLLVVSLLLALTISLGSTLAYLTDTDSDVNVMTLGNVNIEQWENDEVDGFTQGQPLYPAYYEDTVGATLDATGAIEKRVNVKNTGKSPAYVRTIFAFEAGELTKDEFDKYIHLLWNVNPDALDWEDEKVTIKGEDYFLASYTYPTAIEAGAVAGETLLGVVMDKTADNDVMAKLGDSDYNILVVTQACQSVNMPDDSAEALNVAFKELNKDSHPWMDWNGQTDDEGDQDPDEYTVIKTFDELKNAMRKGGNYILGADLEITDKNEFFYGSYVTAVYNDTTLDLNGHSITVDVETDKVVEAPILFYVYAEGASLTVVGDGDVIAKHDAFIFWPRTVSEGLYIYGGNYYNNDETSGTKDDINAIVYSQSQDNIHIYGGTFTFKNVGKHCGGFNVYDNSGAEIVLHEGVLLSNINYYLGSDADEIHLAAGCGIEEVVIDGETWYKVVRTEPADVAIVETAEQ